MANKIQIRRDVAANWTSSNPTLSQGEQGYETDTGKIKIGDGSTAWTSLGYSFEGGSPDLYADNYDGTSTLPSATGTNAVALNVQAEATGSYATALGFDAVASGSFSTATGQGSNAGSSRSVALGFQATTATGSNAAAIGKSYASGTDSFAAAIGNNTSSYGATGSNSIAMGLQAKANSTNGISIGSSTQAAYQALAIGTFSTATASQSAALGYANTASHANAVTIGSNVQSTTTNEVSIGGTADTVRISESYTLPTTDGTNGQVLTTDGSGAVTFADAGGAALELYAENPSSPTAPSATGTNAVAIGSSSLASNSNAIAAGFGSAAQGADSVAIGRGATSSNFSGATSLGLSASAYGIQAVALGKSRASGTDSLAAAISTNSSTYGAAGANSVAIGQNAYAGGSGAVSLGTSSLANGIQSHAFGGTSSGAYSVALGGTASGSVAVSLKGATASGDRSLAVGFRAVASKYGQKAFASGRFAADGDAQGSMFILRAATTDATATIPTADGGSAGSTNQVILPNNSAYAFHGTIVARQQASAGTASAAWKVEGLIRREGSAGTTVLVNSATTVLDNTPSWGMALSADTTNGGLAITVTGAASTNIRWVATIHTSEVTYA